MVSRPYRGGTGLLNMELDSQPRSRARRAAAERKRVPSQEEPRSRLRNYFPCVLSCLDTLALLEL